MNLKKILAFVQMFLMISLVFVFSLTNSLLTSAAPSDNPVCCSKDTSGNYCSYVPASQCLSPNLKASTSCDQTAFCKPGVCSGIDGFCYAGYPKALCVSKKGTYHDTRDLNSVGACKLGCCIIGTQAAYLTKDRCIAETSNYSSLEVDFRDTVTSEQECLNLARNTEQGCCVSSTGCKYGAKSECTIDTVLNGTGFYKETYCSQLQNQCSCAPSNPTLPKKGNGDFKATTCLADRDEVYWRDSCGNPEGVVVAGLSGQKNAALDSGSCDYNTGTICGDSDGDGIKVCESLDCQGGTRGDKKKNDKLSINVEHKNYEKRGTPVTELIGTEGLLNGESWCEWDSPDQEQKSNDNSTVDRTGKDPPGSRYYRHLCISGQELVEPCKDLREEYCYSNTVHPKIEGKEKTYTESRCLKNEWQPCVNECNTADPNKMDAQNYQQALKKDQDCCLGTKRDCLWTGNKCVPAVAPGFKFWEGEGNNICSKGNAQCTATFVCGGWNQLLDLCSRDKDAGAGVAVGGIAAVGAGAGTAIVTGAVLTGPVGLAVVGAGLLIGLSAGNSGWHIVSGGECLSQDYLQGANNLCRSLGDCGADFNYLHSYDNKIPNTLSYAGFSNTNNVTQELADYIKKESGDEGDLQKKKSNPGRGHLTFDFKNGIPGTLKGDDKNKNIEPDWNLGSDFYNFNNDKKDVESKIKRALWDSDDLTRQGWFGKPLVITGVGLGVGVVSSIFFSSLAGSSALAAFTAGASISPLGFLVSTLIGKVGGEKIAGDLGIKAAETAISVGAKTTAQSTFQGLFKGEVSNIFTTQTNYVIDQGVVKSFSLAGKTAIQKAGFDPVMIKTMESELSGKALNVDIVSNSLKGAGEKYATQTAEKIAQEAAKTGFPAYMAALSSIMWAYTIFQLGDVLLEKVEPVNIATTCQSWQAPIYKVSGNEDQCQLCNPTYSKGNKDKDYVDSNKNPLDVRFFKKCSEYRCKSLGASCELINKGTNEETCVTINKLDTNSPKIEAWIEGFVPNAILSKTATGFKVSTLYKIYTPFTVGLKTDEPSQCKMSFSHSKRYNDMENNFFGTNVFTYFHLNEMVYPATKNVTKDGVKLTGGGHYKLYVRCTDAAGNANEADYVLEFDVSNELDVTAPKIIGSSLSPEVKADAGLAQESTSAKEVYLMNNATYTDVTLFINEPSECKYSTLPLDYKLMNETNKCKVTRSTPDVPPYFGCKFVRGVNALGIGPAPSDFISKAGLVKYLYFKCKDKFNNFNKEAYTLVLRGSEAINITSVKPSSDIKTSNDLVNVTLEVKTTGGAYLQGQATCKYTEDINNKNNLAAMTEFISTNSSFHTQSWNPGSGNQTIYVGCYDVAGNTDFDVINFNVEKDVTPPMITRVYKDTSLTPAQVFIELDEKGTCKDSVEDAFDYKTGGNLMVAVGNSGKVFTSTVPNSNIYYVSCSDIFNNTITPNVIIQIA